MENNELPACPVETTLTLIGNKWKVLILRDLMPGSKRFGKLQRSIGKISQKVLTSNYFFILIITFKELLTSLALYKA